jgi:hypothetical protein
MIWEDRCPVNHEGNATSYLSNLVILGRMFLLPPHPNVPELNWSLSDPDLHYYATVHLDLRGNDAHGDITATTSTGATTTPAIVCRGHTTFTVTS